MSILDLQTVVHSFGSTEDDIERSAVDNKLT